MKLGLIAITLFFSAASLAHSQTKSDVAGQCFRALEDGETQTALEIAEIIKAWEQVYSEATGRLAADCLSQVFQVKWIYSRQLSRVLTQEDLNTVEEAKRQRLEEENRLIRLEAELEAERLRAEAEFLENSSLVHKKAYSACSELYLREEATVS